MADLALRLANAEIIMITETWFKDSSIVSLDSYKLFRRDRVGKTGGGVAIYVKNSLISSEVCDNDLSQALNLTSVSGVEQVWCEVSHNSYDGKLLLGCVYRPPLNARTADDKLKHAETATNINKSIAVAAKVVESGLYDGMCLAGDFNYPDLRWNEDMIMNCGKSGGLADKFLDTVESFALHQSVREPTFFSSSGKATNVLDLIITEN